jgi:Protein of unknown function, DUF
LKIEAVKNLAEMSIEAGVPPGFQGCDIIKINSYLFEGHITSDIIKRLLAEHPQNVVGLMSANDPKRTFSRRAMPASVCSVGASLIVICHEDRSTHNRFADYRSKILMLARTAPRSWLAIWFATHLRCPTPDDFPQPHAVARGNA